MTTVKIDAWYHKETMNAMDGEMAKRLNAAGAIGVTVAMAKAPRDTGFMANTIEVIERASAGSLRVVYGNITADYTLWQEIGSQGRPGRYFLRQSLDQAVKQLQKAG